MARLAGRLPENVPGEFFVDDTCIDCDTCRQIAPAVFGRSRRQLSFVQAQPQSAADRQRALMSLVACPTASIGASAGTDARAAAAAFPEPVDENVYYCGYASERSFGASTYLIVRPEGNVLVDSPRAAEPLLRRVEEMGGVRWMFLTHVDDVADHARWQRRFGCERIMHAADMSGGTSRIERRIDGDDPVRLDPDLLVIPVPGHTAGSIALLYRARYLFTGDHLWWSETHERLHASRGVCWYSWAEQRGSVERLLDYDFEWVLPGHGRRYKAESAAAMRQALGHALQALPA